MSPAERPPAPATPLGEAEGARGRRWWSARVSTVPGGDLRAAAVLTAIVLSLFWPLLFGRVLFERDIAVIFHAQAEAFLTAARDGSWPVWNPSPEFGEPMLANANTQVFYPPTWLLLLIPTATYYSAYVLFHLVFGGLGLYALARYLGLSRPAALTGGAVFIVAGPTLSLVNVWHHLAGACWMSWVVLAALHAVRDCTPRSALVWGIAVAGQVFAGSPDVCALTVAATLGAWAAAAPDAFSLRRARSVAGTVALAIAAGTLLSAAQWLPTLAAARGGSRGNFSFEVRSFWSVHPLSLGQLLAPVPLREIVNYSPRGGEMFDVWAPFVGSLYLGTAASVLAAAALAAGPRARMARGLALFALAALLVALGRHTPIYGALTRVVPVLGMFRFPSKAMILVGWAWAMLVALGAEEWARAPTGSWRRGALGALALLAAVLATAAIVTWRFAARGDLPFLGPVAEGGHEVARHIVASLFRACGVAAVAAAAAAWAPRGGRRLAFAVMAIAVADLALAHRDLNPTAPATFFRYRPEILRLLPMSPPGRVFVWDYVVHRPPAEPAVLPELMRLRPGYPLELGRALGLQACLYPLSYGRWGLFGGFDRDMLGLAPPVMGDFVTLVSRVHGTFRYPRLLALGGVDAVVALHDEAPAGLTPLGEVQGPQQRLIRVFGVPQTRPRAYVVGQAVAAEGVEALRTLLDPEFDPSRTVVLAEAPPAQPPALPGSVRVTTDVSDRFEADVDQKQPGWLVRLVTHDPGWRVHVDGAPQPLLRANHVFQAVLVPAGRHHVTFVYRPRPVLVGTLATAMTVPLVVIGLARLRPRDRGEPGAAAVRA